MNSNHDVIEVCKRLIAQQSYSGEEKGVAEVIGQIMQEYGFDEVNVDRYGNVVGLIHGNEEGPLQLYDAHIDTVPLGDESKWTKSPLAGEVVEGKLYGRGTSDMKGAMAAMLVAARNYAQTSKRAFKGTIAVAGVVFEEFFEGVAAREISANYSPDYVVIGEASRLKVKHGQRGRAEIVVETFGKPAHSANPEHGNNAVYQMAEVVNRLKRMECAIDPLLGKGILVLVDIKSSPYPGSSVVPEYCKSTWDRRLLVGETKESVLSAIERELDLLMKEDSTIDVKLRFAKETHRCYTGETIGDERFFPAWFYDKDEAFIRKVYADLREAGFDEGLSHYDFCTNGSHYAGEAKIKTFGFGPSDEFLAHTIDEYIELSQLEKAAEGYQIIMHSLQELGT